MKIIRDQRYAGDMVGNVRVTTKIAKNDNIRVDRDNWIIVEDTHEPIVSKKIFFRVNEKIMPLKERKESLLGDNRRRGFCHCPNCGRILQKSNTTTNPQLYCAHGQYDPACREFKIMQKDLYSVLSDMAGKYVRALIDLDEYVKKSKFKYMANQKSMMSIEDIDKEIEKLKQSTASLYEKYRNEKLTKEEYLQQKQKINMKIEELQNNKLKIMNGIGAKQDQQEWEKKLQEKILKWKNQTTFPESDLAELIERVDFVDGKHLRVRWKFMDYTVKVLKYIMAEQKAS